jgi:hypothetical protein
VHVVDIPFEFVGEVASAGAVAKAGHVKRLTTSRHDVDDAVALLEESFGMGARAR